MKDHTRTHPPTWAIVLGSGLGRVAERVRPARTIPFDQLPELAPCTVDGHAGRVLLGDWQGQRVLLLCGRVHAYEGYSREEVTAQVRLAADLGVRRLILTNAAGGIRDDLTPGTLMAVQDVLDCTRPGFWRREDGTPRRAFPTGMGLTTGTYAAMLGPNYETPAEVRALRAMGADAVGMSTAWEFEAARQCGLNCLAISCITNRAAGLSTQRLTHEEVLLNSARLAGRLADAVEGFLADAE